MGTVALMFVDVSASAWEEKRRNSIQDYYNKPDSNETASSRKPSVPKQPIKSLAQQFEESRKAWICSVCTFKNHPALPTCEMCDTARYPPVAPSQRESPSPSKRGSVNSQSPSSSIAGCTASGHVRISTGT